MRPTLNLLYAATKIESPRDFLEVQNAMGEDYRWFEIQANSFAGLVLVPPASLKARFTARLAEAVKGGLSASAVLDFPLRAKFIKGLAGDFNVSEDCMGIRLEKDELIPTLV